MLEKLRDLRKKFAANLRGKLAVVEEGWGWIASEVRDEKQLDILRLEQQYLAGSAATFGFVAISPLCRELGLILQCLRDGHIVYQEQQTRISRLLGELTAEIDNAEQSCGQNPLPFNLADCQKKMEESASEAPAEPYRILVAGADLLLARALATVLEHGGIKTVVESLAGEVLNRVGDFKPDVILLDIQGTDCSGVDLALALRRNADYDAIHVIFLAPEPEFDKYMAAHGLGGDDFITKPVELNYLPEIILPRLKRVRAANDMARQVLDYQAHIEELADERAFRLKALLDFSRELTASVNLKSLYRKITLYTQRLIGFDFSTLLLLTGDKRKMVRHDTVDISGSTINVFQYPQYQGLVEYMVQGKKPVVVPDFRKETRFEVPVVLHEKGITSALCMPMMIDQEVLGVLIGHSLEKREFNEGEISLYQRLANQAAVAIKNIMNLEALKASEERFKTMVEQSPLSVQVLDPDGFTLQVNRAWEELWGLKLEDLAGYNIRQDRQLEKFGILPYLNDAFAGQSSFVSAIEYDARDTIGKGQSRWVQAYIYPIRDEAGGIRNVVLMHEDITETKRAEMALKRASDFNGAIINAMFDGMAIIDAHNFTITRVNQAFLDQMGLREEEVLGRTCYEVTHNRTSPCRAPEDPCPLITTLDTGLTQVYEHVHYKKDGTPTYHEVGTSPIRDADGKIIQVLHVSRDVSERKKLEQQLLQAQKMEAIGRLSGGVAHDFNNLLTVIIGYSELVMLSLPEDSPLRGKVEMICSAGKTAAELTRQLLAFSRKQILEMKVVSLNAIIDNTAKMLRRIIGEDLELIMHTRSFVGNIMADPSQVEQVLMNLSINAKDAMPRGGTLTIETSVVTLDESYVKTQTGVTPGEYVQLTVSDTGEGMPRHVQEQIFEPFYTTKESGKGTGLGLATVYGIVKQHKGNIYVYSELGKGTVFKVYFPLVAEEVEEAHLKAGEKELPKGVETILVVDDDAGIHRLVNDTLSPLGYRVIAAISGENALEVSRMYNGEIDLLLTDVIMPGMSGRQLVEVLSPLRPAMRVAYMSGYSDSVMSKDGNLPPGMHYLNKPLLPSKFAEIIRDILDNRE